MKHLNSTDLSELLGLTPENENAAAAGPRNGANSVTTLKIDFSEDSKNNLEEQAWAELDAAPQWCAWREERRGESWTKVPYSTPQRKARANDPATWLNRTRADAVAADLAAERLKGVGLFLGGAGDLRFGGIDLDSCLGLLGDLEPWAAEVLARFASYAEVSPSGTGAKVFFAYRAADLEPVRAIMGTKWGKSFSRGSHHEIALHLGNRYFTVTGNALTPRPRRSRRSTGLRWNGSLPMQGRDSKARNRQPPPKMNPVRAAPFASRASAAARGWTWTHSKRNWRKTRPLRNGPRMRGRCSGLGIETRAKTCRP